MVTYNKYNEYHLGNRSSMIKKGLCFWPQHGIKWIDNNKQKQSLLLCVVKEKKDNLRNFKKDFLILLFQNELLRLASKVLIGILFNL